jgi:hypothetical protein
MKFLIVFFTMFLPASQQITPNLAPITKAISEGDAATLSNYFDNSVDITLLDKQQVYDKAQATNLLRDFFSKSKPRAFNTVHQGSAKGASSHYIIGDLSATSGSFRVYVYYKTAGDRPLIQEIRIEK